MTGSATLASISVLAGLSGCATQPEVSRSTLTADAAPQWHFLSPDDRTLLAALIPAIVGPEFPREESERKRASEATLRGVDEAIHFMGPPNQAELRQLFDLLNFAPTRLTLARVTSSWENVDSDQGEAFLQRWRDSRMGLFNNAYLALVQITNAAWYGHPDNAHLSGYSGPPDWVRQSLPQLQNPSA